MSQLRLDPLTGRWVAIALERAVRPSAFAPRRLPVEDDAARPCPFCPEHEQDPPPALERVAPSGEWQVRVVPNLYPAFSGHEAMVVTHLGPVFTQAPASGIHEVLVLTPAHDGSWGDLTDDEAELVMTTIRDRVAAHAETPGLRYSQVIVNHGREAGASIAHPHGQLLGIPFVPGEIAHEQAGFARFAGSSLLTTVVEAEIAAGHRVVHADQHVVVVCPFWSGTPFEMLVIPRDRDAHLHHASPDSLRAVGRGLRHALARLRAVVGDVAYNLVFHSAPYRAQGEFHWHVHVLPKLATRAGFELGTGVYINVVAPEDAAQELRAARAADDTAA